VVFLTVLGVRGILRPARVLNGPPEAILAILRSAQTGTPDPRLGAVLEEFRRQWLTIARTRYRSLRDDLDDAVQIALVKIVSTEKLARLKEADRIEAWARSIFVHVMLDVAREAGRQRARRTYLGAADEDPEDTLRDRLPADAPTPEEAVAFRERLAIVSRCIEKVDVARLKFVEDLPEKEIAARQNLTRDGVAGQLKRIRRGLRIALGEPD
jgi:RNA polymerase sigma factor (sigma-70 family)